MLSQSLKYEMGENRYQQAGAYGHDDDIYGVYAMSGIISAEGAEKAFHTLERPKIADNINPVSKPHTSVPIIIGTQQKDMFAGGIEITAMSVSAKNNITPHSMPVMQACEAY